MDFFLFEHSVHRGQWWVPWFSLFISGWIAPVPMVWEADWTPRPVDHLEDSTTCIPNGRGNMIINHFTDWAISAFTERGVAFKIF